MATRTETDITLYTSEELQEIQSNSHSGSTTDSKGNIQAVLSAIITYTKAAAEANRDYVDILWSSIKTGSYTAKILGWIDMKPEKSVEEHKYGIADTIWKVDIGDRITESGCSWIFVYNRDSEEPAGLRISWWKESEDDTENPIDVAWENNPWIILPENKYVFPTATEVDTVIVQVNELQTNKNLISNIFSTIHYHIQNAAKSGYNNVHIPWNALGDTLSVQEMFVETLNASIAGFPSDASVTAIHDLFNYGTRTNGYYPKAVAREFTVEDFDPMEMGFFNDATYLEDNYVNFDPEEKFSLYQILSSILGYGVVYQAAINPQDGTSYCGGLTFYWTAEGSYTDNYYLAQSVADTAYQEALDTYNNSQVSVLSWENGAIPNLDAYIAANKKNNTMWLKSFIDLTASKMKTAFAKGDRAISILWSEVSSSYADEVKRAWQNSDCEYEGRVDPIFEGRDSLSENTVASLQYAYNHLMKGQFYSASSLDPDSITYTYGYIRYKNSSDTGGSGSTNGSGSGGANTTIMDISYDDSIGLAITLYGYVASSPQSGSTADAQAASAIRSVQATWITKEAPKS